MVSSAAIRAPKRTLKAIISVLFKLFKFVFSGILLGVVTGAIVSYLFSTPTIALVKTNVTINRNNVDLSFTFKNEGKSKAVNLRIKYFYGFEGMDPDKFETVSTTASDFIEAGDNIGHIKYNLKLHDEGKAAIIYMMIRYSDESAIRQLINESLLGRQYYIEKLMIHQENKKQLSAIAIIDQNIKKRYQDRLRSRMLPLF